MQSALLYEGEQIVNPAAWLSLAVAAIRITYPAPAQTAGRKVLVQVVMGMTRYAHLVQIVRTLCPVGRIANDLHGGHQEPNEDGNDGNHDKQFDQSKTRANSPASWHLVHR